LDAWRDGRLWIKQLKLRAINTMALIAPKQPERLSLSSFGLLITITDKRECPGIQLMRVDCSRKGRSP
jgi:hypothetical protein